MKPISVTLENINSFREAQTADFASLADGGNMFCISGDTGSGKSTIFSAMLLALYQKPKGANLSDFINLSADKARVEFTFEADGKTYVSRRELSRSRQNKNTLSENGVPIASGDEAFEKLKEIVGLDVEQFTQVALLEQGKFSKFLDSKPSERFDTLSRLLGLERFRKLYSIANSRAKDVEGDLREIRTRLDGMVRDGRTKERLRALTAELKTLEKEIAELRAKETSLDGQIKSEEAKRALHNEIVRIAAERNKAQAAVAAAERTLAALAEKCADPEKETEELVRREQELKGVAETKRRLEEEFADKSKELQRSRDEYKKVKAEYDRIGRELAESLTADVDNAVALILHAAKPGDKCPVCGGTISRHSETGGSVSARAEKDKRHAELGARLEQIEKDGRRIADETAKLRDRIAKEVTPFGDVAGEMRNLQAKKTTLQRDRDDRKKAENALTENRTRYETLCGELEKKGKDEYNEENGRRLAEEYRTVKENLEVRIKKESADRNERTAVENALKEAEELEKRGKELSAEESRLKKLSDLFKSDGFLKFVANEYVRDFTVSASAIMNRLSGGNYTLEYRDEKFYIRDFLNENKERGVNTLSGGETFLASLSIAISVMQYISAGKSFEFFFLDEGFGTLHEEAVETVVSALRELAKDVTVGIISHVDDLVERVQSRIRVEHATDSHGSRITVC